MKLLNGLLFISLVMPAVACGNKRINLDDLDTRSVHSVENQIVRKYLAEVNYPDDDYSFTKVTDYYQYSTTYRKDWPNPLRVSWTIPEDAMRQSLMITDESGKTVYKETLAPNQKKTDIYNLIPGNRYTVKVIANGKNGNNIVALEKAVSVIGPRCMYRIDGIYNVRDLGGLYTADGKQMIKYGKIIRGGEMNGPNDIEITPEGKTEALRLGIGADVDLRKDDMSLYITESPLGSGVEYVRFPDTVNNHYGKLLDGGNFIKMLRWIIRQQMKNPDKAVYIHCKVGADRTGTAIFLIEGLLGVSENDACKDFELTSFSNPPGLRNRNGTSHNYSALMDRIKSVPGETIQDKCYNYFTSGIVKGGDRIGISPVDSIAWFMNHMLEEK